MNDCVFLTGPLLIGNSSMTTLSVFAHLTSIGSNGVLVTVGSHAYAVVITSLRIESSMIVIAVLMVSDCLQTMLSLVICSKC